MPIRKIIMHMIDKKPDGSPAVLHTASEPLAESEVNEELLWRLSESYNAKQGKALGPVPRGVRRVPGAGLA